MSICATQVDAPSCPVCGGPAARLHRVVRAGAVASCGSCGSWYRSPRPGRDELAAIYTRDYYDSWGLGDDDQIARHTKRATFEPILRLAGQAVLQASPTDGRASAKTDAPPSPSRPRPRLLDVGAATGLLVELAAEKGWDPYAVELNPGGAKLLRRRLGPSCVFEGELTECPFAPGSFDAITMTDVLEHVLEVGPTLSAAAAMLRPGGVLLATTPRVDSLSRRLMGGHWLHFKAEHIQYFSAAAIRQAVERAGFTDVRVLPHAKVLTFDYLYRQLSVYPHWLLTPLSRLIHRLAPRTLRRRLIAYRCGEALIVARRSSEPKPECSSCR